jgi:hypothetical protein
VSDDKKPEQQPIRVAFDRLRLVLLAIGTIWILPRFHLMSLTLTTKGWISEHAYRVENAQVEDLTPENGRLVCYWIDDSSMPYWEGDFIKKGETTPNNFDRSPPKLAIEDLCSRMNRSLTSGFVPRTLAPGVTIESNWRRFF